ncbi:MAG TPA: FAD-dependent oxidoreductase [Dehalococcoidia bacterium]|nr:FAD-dependent oxidoreductase [Dehalococcoidia bacterium]
MSNSKGTDLIVVGAGLAGLSAAIFAARLGMRVVVLERGADAGGRARSTEKDGFWFNLGPRALYPPAAAILDELGVPFSGKVPPLTGYVLADRGLYPLSPMAGGLEAMLAAPPFTGSSGLAAGRALGELLSTAPATIADQTLAAWVTHHTDDDRARQLVFALVRLAGYIDAPDLLSAAAAQAQMLEAIAGVRYLDGGWQTIVDGLLTMIEELGVEIRSRSRAIGLVLGSSGVKGVTLSGGESLQAPNVILAADPLTARGILASAGAGIPPTTPVRAAVLDLALTQLPNPEGEFILSLDRPLYLSVHSVAARLAPGSGALVHVALYLHPDEKADADVRGELEWLLDQVQPGWRDLLVHSRFLPDITVTHALPEARTGGLQGRPAVAVDGLPGAFLAGDWVGDEHQLAAAAIASARRAVNLASVRGAPSLAGVAV